MSRRARLVTIAVACMLIVPVAAVASNRFTDVPSSNVFHDDITWLADATVTLGCNPPANDRFCPSDVVTRQQMAAFMRRLADNQVVDAGTLQGMTADELINASPRGPRGDAGPKGDPGTANVQYSPWFTLRVLNNQLIDGTLTRGATLSVPDLAGGVLNTASIEVYLKLDGRIFQLPYRSRGSGFETTIDWVVDNPGELRIYRVTDNCGAPPCLVTMASGLEFRYVITPGGTPLNGPAGPAAAGLQDTQLMDTESPAGD